MSIVNLVRLMTFSALMKQSCVLLNVSTDLRLWLLILVKLNSSLFLQTGYKTENYQLVDALLHEGTHACHFP